MTIDDLTPDDDFANTPDEPVLDFTEDDVEHFTALGEDVILGEQMRAEENFDWDAWLIESNATKEKELDDQLDISVSLEKDESHDRSHS